LIDIPTSLNTGGVWESCVMSPRAGATAPLTPVAFIKKWKKTSLTERQTAQEHFLDLCALFDHPTPTEDDPTGEFFAFEKGALKVGGGRGFADQGLFCANLKRLSVAMRSLRLPHRC
jgi:hypothetical protein